MSQDEPMAAVMDSTFEYLQVQTPQLHPSNPDDGTSHASSSRSFGQGGSVSNSTLVSTSLGISDPSLLPSPRSSFDFTWALGLHTARPSRLGARPPRSFSSGSSPSTCKSSFHSHGTRQRQSVGHRRGTSTLNLSCATTGSPSSSISNPCNSSPVPNAIDTAAWPTAQLGTSSNSSPTGANFVISASSSPTRLSPRTTKQPPPPPPPPPGRMPPSRPAKRSADGGGISDDDTAALGGGKSKQARSDRGPEDFSSVVKNRLQSYSRTGQACDRCKVRKIRCDALAEGCSHCINLNLECYVTDRVTGRTERRGYLQQLEREKNSMLTHIRDLERLCAERGVQVKPWQQTAPSAQSPSEPGAGELPGSTCGGSKLTDGWSRYGALWIKYASISQPADATIRPRIPQREWQSRPDQICWGVVGDDAPFSSLKGTTLTLLGTTIETTSFDAPDIDEPAAGVDSSMPLYNKSMLAFLRSSMGVNPVVQAELPSRENAFMYAEWYFISVACFLPLLHKPTFFKLLTRIYDEPDFKPTVSQTVVVHMVFANILFQFAVRNSQTLEQRNTFNDISNKHYHFALSKMYDILSTPGFEALQALILMASHARAFPKPGCGSISVNIALHRALELGLNRRTKNAGEPTDLQNELRKRAWWCIMTVVVAIYGKRGYPMPVSVQDFDVDFLEPVADELLSDDGVDRSRTLPCPYEMAICGHKIIPTVMEMYANLYSVRRDQSNYKTVVAALESQVEQWEAQLPDSMRLKGHKALDPGMVGPLFARCCLLELRLHIRHPSLAMTNDRAMIAENTRICEEMAREYLQTVELLSKMKALDTTWYQLSYYCVAILSMLFPRWERRFEITQEEIATLRGEMDRWMDIIKEMSSLLGCGMGIGKQISQLIDRTMAWIEYDMKNKNMKHSSQGPADFKQEQSQLLQSALPQPGPGRQALNQSSSYPTAPGQHAPISSAGSSHRDGQAEAFYQTGASNNSSQAAFTSVAYVNQQTPATAHAAVPYQHEQPGLFYPPTATTVAPAQSPLPAQHDAVVHYGQPLGQQAPDEVWRSSWQDWSAAIAESQARLSANALLTLGGGNAGRNPVIAPVMTDSSMPHNGNQVAMVLQPAQWPLVMFEQPPQE